MSVGSIFRGAQSDLSQMVTRATSGIKPVFGTIIGGVAVSVLGAGERAIDRAKARVTKQIGEQRAQIEPGTRVGLVGLFGGVPVSAVVLVVGLTVVAVLLLKRK